MRKIALVTTGGTIEKTYDEQTGELANRRSLVHRMLSELRLEATAVTVHELMSKDSLEMTDDDRGQDRRGGPERASRNWLLAAGGRGRRRGGLPRRRRPPRHRHSGEDRRAAAG